MAKLTVLKGLPASGKSTYARQLVDETGNTARVNRDDLRRMLFNGKWSGYREKLVIAVEKAIVKTLIGGQNHNVIVDDTNLRRNIWQDFECPNLTATEVHQMDTSMELCLQRDRYRGTKELGRVGRAIIQKMALEAGMLDFSHEDTYDKPPIVICDIDGTVANLDHRVHYMRTKPKDHDNFYAAIPQDTPYPVVIDWVHELYHNGYLVIMLSGRGEEYAIETEDWLYKYGPPYDYLFMRQSGNHEDDVLVKTKLLHAILRYVPKERIAFAIDDRPRVVEYVWRRNGIRCIPVHQDRWMDVDDLATVKMNELIKLEEKLNG